jgi:hypothetical protein
MPNLQTVPPQEQHIFDQLTDIRTHLSALKKDRSQYLSSKDVLFEYEKILGIVKELDSLRAKQPEDTPGNKVDQVLDDVFQVLSLFFMAVGLTKTAPATYASLTTVQRLLEHLNESKVFTQEDLSPIKERLSEINKLINAEGSGHDQNEFSLLKQKLSNCLQELHLVESKIEQIDPELFSIYEKLVHVRRELLSLASRPNQFHKESLDYYRAQLAEIGSKIDIAGKFQSLESGKVKEDGQNVLNGLLDDCNILMADLSISNFTLDASLMPIYDELIRIKSQLEDLLVTRRWTLRQTDLYAYQKRLQEIDDLRINGKFSTGDRSDQSEHDLNRGQSVLLYLLRRCYAIIYKLLESCEPVSEALQPLHNQLSTVRRCLLEVKRMGGVNNSRELYPFQMKLASLDNLRKDGKFIVDGEVPEGQGTLNALLAECYDIIQEMRIEAEEKAEGDDDEAAMGTSKDDDNYNYGAQNPYDNDVYEREEEEEEEEDEDIADYDDLNEDIPSYAPSIADSEANTTL